MKTVKKSKIGKTQKSVYKKISKNVYFDGSSYRYRITKNGVCQSKNFSDLENLNDYLNDDKKVLNEFLKQILTDITNPMWGDEYKTPLRRNYFSYKMFLCNEILSTLQNESINHIEFKYFNNFFFNFYETSLSKDEFIKEMSPDLYDYFCEIVFFNIINILKTIGLTENPSDCNSDSKILLSLRRMVENCFENDFLPNVKLTEISNEDVIENFMWLYTFMNDCYLEFVDDNLKSQTKDVNIELFYKKIWEFDFYNRKYKKIISDSLYYQFITKEKYFDTLVFIYDRLN